MSQPRVPAPMLVLGGIVSVQFGGALAATLIPEIGVGGSALLRLALAMLVMLAISRPTLSRHSRAAWTNVLAFGLSLGLMNWSFYGALAHLPIGVAVTVEFLGPLALAAALSRRPRDLVAVSAAALGVVLISGVLHESWSEVSWVGLLLALAAGACWASYIIFSGRTGGSFPKLDGLSLAMVVAAAVVLPAGLGSVPQWTGESLLKGAGIALLSSVLPYSLELVALRTLSAQVFGILLSLEPAVAAVAGLFILGQHLATVQVVGMALVVLASALAMGGAEEVDEPGRLEGA